MFFILLFVIGVVDSLNWDIFSYFFVLFYIYLGYGCAVVVRRRQVRISWIGSSRVRIPPCAQITKMLIQVRVRVGIKKEIGLSKKLKTHRFH